jgi:hypothetical protein
VFGKKHRAAVILLVVYSTTALMVPEAALGIGGAPPPALFIGSYPTTQKVNAGSVSTYDIWVMAEWKDKFNLTVGLPIAGGSINGQGQIISSLPDKLVDPLPQEVEVNYPKNISLDYPGYNEYFPISVKVSPNMARSTITLRIVISGTLKRSDYSNQSTYATVDLLLYVEPKNTPLGPASTVLYEGFDRDYQMFDTRDTRGSNGWTITSPGGTEIINNLIGATGDFTKPSLQLTKTFIDYGVGIEHAFPRLNSSFILETAMLAADKRINFTFSLVDSIRNVTINAGLSQGYVTVQGKQFTDSTTWKWYKFRLEANQTSHTFKWYLDDRYQGTLPFTGNPDRIRIEISGSGVGTGYVDDIFLEKIIEPPPTTNTSFTSSSASTSTSSEASAVQTTTVSTSTTTVITVSTTLTSTTTFTQQLEADFSTYAWAISATVATIVLAVVLFFQRRTRQ